MKCQFVCDVSVDVSTMDDEHKAKIHFRQVRDRAGKTKMEPYFPAGTEYEHPAAVHFVERGVAIPSDDECREACAHISSSELKRLQEEYAADAAGISDKDDRELFKAGVIEGYEQVNGKTAYKPGPNWKRYRTAQEKLKQQQEASEI